MNAVFFRRLCVFTLVALLFFSNGSHNLAKAESSLSTSAQKEDEYQQRLTLYQQFSALSGIPWYVLAAIDQYERTLSVANPKTRPLRDGIISIFYTDQEWAGTFNPDPKDTDPVSISFFQGKGLDGDGDGRADRNCDVDVMYTMVTHLLKHGTAPDDLAIGLWQHYKNPRSVQRILQFAKIYETFGKLDLFEHAFPLSLQANYSYRSTWGAARSYGGYRIHEGTDLFASYGVPVRSTSYGIIEVKGWNRFGGWRVGIRDLNNVYHYYAHLSGFNKEFQKGDVVKPGDVIGWVGSSGYGKPGTQGKFTPHLHYGLYRDVGLTEWSFDPYPYLRKWEQEERRRNVKQRS